jgi:hypothetical protein
MPRTIVSGGCPDNAKKRITATAERVSFRKPNIERFLL